MTAVTDRNKQMVKTYVHDVINRGINDDGTGRHPDNVDGMLEALLEVRRGRRLRLRCARDGRARGGRRYPQGHVGRVSQLAFRH